MPPEELVEGRRVASRVERQQLRVGEVDGFVGIQDALLAARSVLSGAPLSEALVEFNAGEGKPVSGFFRPA